MYSLGDHKAKLNLCLKPAFYKERLWLTFHPPSHPCLWDSHSFFDTAVASMNSVVACVGTQSLISIWRQWVTWVVHVYEGYPCMHMCLLAYVMFTHAFNRESKMNGWVVCEKERKRECVSARARICMCMWKVSFFKSIQDSEIRDVYECRCVTLVFVE